MIRVTFACGHRLELEDSASGVPVCPTCGERRVGRVTARAPRFRGVCLGPCASYERTPGVQPVLVEEPHG